MQSNDRISYRVIGGTVTNFLVEREAYIKRHAVRKMADDLLAGLPTKIMHKGRQYMLGDVFASVAEHDLFASAALAAYTANPHPIKDLIRRVAQFAICEHLFEGESESLGFIP